MASPSISHSPRARKAEHLPSLDGLRALSIGLVLLGHVGGTRGFPAVDLRVGDYAHLGVVVFFVISGFLITRLMLLERAAKGQVSLKRFYLRRALRLFPAAYAYIAVVCLLWAAGFLHLHATDIWHAVTYTVNYLPEHGKQIGHLWSLSVEEQFYLLWPLAFVLLAMTRLRWLAVGVLALGPLARAFAWFFLQGTPYRDLEMFPMIADTLAMGCLLALLSGSLERRAWYQQLLRPIVSLSLLGIVLLLNRYMDYTVVAVLGTSILNVCLAILIHRCILRPDDWFGRFLNWKPVAFVGVLSYSFYLWQQLFLNRQASAWINIFPQNILLAILAGLGSYYLLEQPLLKLRRQLRP